MAIFMLTDEAIERLKSDYVGTFENNEPGLQEPQKQMTLKELEAQMRIFGKKVKIIKKGANK